MTIDYFNPSLFSLFCLPSARSLWAHRLLRCARACSWCPVSLWCWLTNHFVYPSIIGVGTGSARLRYGYEGTRGIYLKKGITTHWILVVVCWRYAALFDLKNDSRFLMYLANTCDISNGHGWTLECNNFWKLGFSCSSEWRGRRWTT